MKISFTWLKELVALPAGTSVADVARRLTLGGLEVESVTSIGREVSGVKIAEVRAVRPHPGADKLRIVRVSVDARDGGAADTGTEVVCGAPNVPAPGGRVAWAAPGATLPGGFKIARKEIRGFDSPGMLCSEKELGLSDAAEGILILPATAAFPIGGDLIEALGIADDVLEVNVTPNRPDALSHAGIAREVAAAFQVAWRLPPVAANGPGRAAVSAEQAEPGASVSVTVEDGGACPRYMATVVRGLRVAPSPPSIRNRLGACGVRAISNLVDVTNYEMFETGHPLHAFDLDKVQGGIVVRRARPGERIQTLDGVDRALEPEDVVIADSSGPVALAGVMGGARTEVSASTVNVVLEAATFDPRAVRRTAKRLGLHSEASHRFERGVDAEGVPVAAARAAARLAELGGGAVVGAPVDVRVAPAAPRVLALPLAKLARTAGFDIPADEAAAKLRGIEFGVEVTGGELVVTVPSFRPDVTIPIDLVEEVMRLVGFDRAPARLPPGGKAPGASPESLADRARDVLAALGLHEIAGWAFLPRASLAALGDGRLAWEFTVRNPISSDYEVMRTSLLPGLADAARRNLARGVHDLGLFEVGPTIFPEEGDAHHRQHLTAAALLVGQRPGWLKPGAPVDFFDAKQIAVELLTALGVRAPRFVPFAAGQAPSFVHPGVSASIELARDGAASLSLGFAAELHPRVARRFGIEVPVFAFELGLDALSEATPTFRATATPRFPAVTRDISFWIDTTVSAEAQQAAMRSPSDPLLRDIAVLEDFRDPRFAPAGKKGMLWTLTYRADDRTLTDAEVDAAHTRIITALTKALPIQLR